MGRNNSSMVTTKGQMMLLAVVLIGTSILVISSIAGYMMLQRLRMASNIVDSTKAIMAADAGIECELYNFFTSAGLDCEALQFDDVKINVETQVGDSNGDGVNDYIKSIGDANKLKRAFMVSF